MFNLPYGTVAVRLGVWGEAPIGCLWVPAGRRLLILLGVQRPSVPASCVWQDGVSARPLHSALGRRQACRLPCVSAVRAWHGCGGPRGCNPRRGAGAEPRPNRFSDQNFDLIGIPASSVPASQRPGFANPTRICESDSSCLYIPTNLHILIIANYEKWKVSLDSMLLSSS